MNQSNPGDHADSALYPVRHKRGFPFNPTIRLSLDYRKLFMEIQKMDDELDRFILGDEDYMELVDDAFSANIHWSTSIDGNPLSQEEVRQISTEILSGKGRIGKAEGPYQEIVNHLYSYIFKDMISLPWNQDSIKEIHRILMRNVGYPLQTGGIRKERSCVTDKDGFEYFTTCPPENIGEELDSLLEWLNTSPYDSVVTSAVFLHELESIHPFHDGNGRIGRVILHMLLQELGLKNVKLCKVDKEILSDPERYYTLLAETDRSGDYEPFITYVANAVHLAYSNAVREFGRNDVLRDLDDASRTLAVRSKGAEMFTVSQANDWVDGLSEQSVRNKLNELTNMGILIKEGRTRATRFRFNDPIIPVREEMSRTFR